MSVPLRRFMLVILLFAGCMVGVAREGFAQDNGDAKQSSFLQVLQQTYLNNPQILSARARLRSVYEQLPQARAGWLPTVTTGAGAQNTDIDGNPMVENSSTRSVNASVTQPLFRGGRTVAGMAQARKTINAELEALHSVEQDILLAAATAYLDVVQAQSLLELSENNLRVLRKEHEAAREGFEVGELTRTDVSQALSRVKGAEAGVITAKGDLRSARAVFEEITGTQPGKLSYPDNLRYKVPDDLDRCIEMALERNPEALSAEYLHSAAEEQVDVVWGELLPDIRLSGSWEEQFESGDDNTTTQTIAVNATMPLYEGGATRSRVREAKELSNQYYMDILDARRRVRQQTISAWETLAAARAEIESREAQVESAELAQEGVNVEAEFGERTVLDVLDAEQEYLDARVSLVTARRNSLVALFSLIKQLGALTPQTLGFAHLEPDYQGQLDAVEGKIFSMDVEDIGQ